jgi:TatD DNase family protein
MLIDIGVNLLSRQFRRDREAVVARAQAAGVGGMLVTVTELNQLDDAQLLCRQANLHCTAGIHPHNANDAPRDWQATLLARARHPSVRAIGETGLDFNRNFSPPAIQTEVFAAHVDIARQLHKPLFIHDRESNGELIAILQQAGPLPPCVIHCFTGTPEELSAYLAAGFYIGITGWVTDPERGAPLRALVPEIPLSRLLLETDAPYLKPFNTPAQFMLEHALPSRYKRRCEPAMLPYVLQQVAHLRVESELEIAAATSRNAADLFGFEIAH